MSKSQVGSWTCTVLRPSSPLTRALKHMYHAGKAQKAQAPANGGPGQMKAKQGGKGQPKQKAGDALKSGFRQRTGQKGQQQGRPQKQFGKQARGRRTTGKP